MFNFWETINRNLDGHRRGFASFEATVEDLRAFFLQQYPQDIQAFFQPLWAAFSEPLQARGLVANVAPNVHAVITRACAVFGPAAELPMHVFGLLS